VFASAPASSFRFAVVVSLLCLAAAAPAGARSDGVRVGFAPQRVVQGSEAAIGVTVRPAGARCALKVRYKSGNYQPDLAAQSATGGRAVWRWRVPLTAATGRAKATVSCGRAGRVSRRFMIVGQVIPPRITVEKKGFSVRNNPYGGASVSYGLLLTNDSPKFDALKVYVLVNFVMADNHLIGTATTTVPLIPAGGTYALGSDLGFPGAAPVDRLEVVIQVGGHARTNTPMPALANVHIMPDQFDQTWMGEVDGELINPQPSLVLQSAQLSAVILDQSGNVVGGGSGYAFATLPPASRQVIKMTSGFRSIRMVNAASAIVSVEPTWVQGGG